MTLQEAVKRISDNRESVLAYVAKHHGDELRALGEKFKQIGRALSESIKVPIA